MIGQNKLTDLLGEGEKLEVWKFCLRIWFRGGRDWSGALRETGGDGLRLGLCEGAA